MIRKEKLLAEEGTFTALVRLLKVYASFLLFLKRLYLDYLHAISKEEMYGKRNSCKACASEKQILQTSGLKKIHAPKIFHPPFGYL